MTMATLTRLAYMPFGTFGQLDMPDGHTLYTVERMWLGNERNRSCIPEGTYKVQPSWYYRGGYQAPEILDVPNRSRILFHVGNWPESVSGCIAVGTDFACVGGRWGVSNSRRGFGLFMETLGSEEFELHIKHVGGAVWDGGSKIPRARTA